MASIKKKIKMCGVELMAWGSSTTNSDTTAIKELQKKLDILHEAEFLELSKGMDELLQKQEIYWA